MPGALTQSLSETNLGESPLKAAASLRAVLLGSKARFLKVIRMKISQDQLKDSFHFRNDIGRFIWKVAKGWVKPGRIAGTLNEANGYRYIKLNGVHYLEHRMVWLFTHGRLPKGEIDHINGDKQDNRIENLRECTRSQNEINKGLSSTNTSGCKGVSWHAQSKKWRARIKVNKKEIHLGTFECKADAEMAYRSFLERTHGDFLASGMRSMCLAESENDL
ncbi:HNH endonuclease [Cronobacter sakazakii]|nr:HNH endonuclease [Cronobacter sakazakii]MCI0221142.1 HNH endonuclease [Cronobacter sakazakii]